MVGTRAKLEHHLQHITRTLATAARILNFDIKECIQYAYDQIKDRYGKMIDGVFVKGADL